MFRRCFIVLITLVLVVASATVTSMAQSGRGRQLRIQRTLRNESVAPVAAEVQDDQKIEPGSSAVTDTKNQRFDLCRRGSYPEEGRWQISHDQGR
jgi:hypothetical protein